VLRTDVKVFPAPIVAFNDCPFLVGCRHRRRRMPPALAALRVLAQMRIRRVGGY
jgi:hypothetical protein